MEGYITCRVVLGMLCLIHCFAVYGIQCPWGHIKAKVLKGFMLTELVAVTAYIIYDIVQVPPHDGWFLAILGYLLVYTLILITWILYSKFTWLEENKVYEMTIKYRVRLNNKDYFQGTVSDGEQEYTVLLPYSSELKPITEANKIQKVKFAEVYMYNVVVKLV